MPISAQRWRWTEIYHPERSDAMELAVPGDETRQSHIDRRTRRKAEVALALGDVGISRRHVARRHRRELDRRLPPEHGLEKADEAPELLAAVIAEIVEAIGRRLAVVRRRPVEAAEHARDDVVDVSEVAPHVAMIEDADRPPREN